jgi:integrase
MAGREVSDRSFAVAILIVTAAWVAVSAGAALCAHAPLRRSAFWTEWNLALKQAGVPAIRFHELRHYYASLLIRHGQSVKTVQAPSEISRTIAD